MKKTALFSILLLGMCLMVTVAQAEDDVFKKMRAFKAVMDTLPETTKPEPEPVLEIEDPEPTPAPVEPMVEPEIPVVDIEPERMQEDIERMIEEQPKVMDREAPSWISEQEDTGDDVLETIEDDIDTTRPVTLFEILDSKPAAMTPQSEEPIEETGYEWPEETVEKDIVEDTKPSAQEIKTLLETEISAEVPSLEKAAPEKVTIPDTDDYEPVAEVMDFGSEMNIPDTAAVGKEESEISAAVSTTTAASAGAEMDIAESSLASSQPEDVEELDFGLEEVPAAIPEQDAVPEELEVLKYRQDLSQELTGDMIDQHAHIDQIKSEIDAEINQIQSDIEMITGAKRGDQDGLSEE